MARPFFRLPGGFHFAADTLTAWHASPEECRVYFSGNTARSFARAEDRAALEPLLQKTETLALPDGLHLRPERVAGWRTEDGALQLFLRDVPDTLLLQDPGSQQMFLDHLGSDIRFAHFSEGTALEAGDVAAVVDEEADVSFTAVYLASGSEFAIGEGDRDAVQRLLKSGWDVNPSIRVRSETVAALRQAYAGPQRESEEWVLYLGHGHQLPLGDLPGLTFAQRLKEKLPGLAVLPGGAAFIPERWVADVFEKPRTEIFEPRLGIYLQEGHEFNLYDRADVEAGKKILESVYRQEKTVSLPSGIHFNNNTVIAWEKSAESASMEIVIANGPGIRVTEADDVAIVTSFLNHPTF